VKNIHTVCWWPFPPFQWTRGLADYAKQAESIRWEEASHCQNTEVRGNVLQFQLWKPAPPVLWRCNAFLHGLLQIFGHGVRQADQSEYRGWRSTSIRPFTAGTFRVKEFVQKRDHSNRLHAYIWLQDIRYSCWYVCESDLGQSLLTIRQRDGQSTSEMAVNSVKKDVGSQRHHAFH